MSRRTVVGLVLALAAGTAVFCLYCLRAYSLNDQVPLVLCADEAVRGPLHLQSIEIRPSEHQPRAITLVVDEKKRTSVEFILDCSQSMDEATPIKPGGRAKAQRLDMAKAQLKSVLDKLVVRGAKGEEVHVGVRFFGHRVGWLDGAPNGKMIVVPSVAAQAVELRKLGPSRDTELAFAVGKFDNLASAAIQRRIGALRPWGETPLFLALKQSLADFRQEPLNARKFIIAITDGENMQSTPDTNLADVLNAWEKDKVAIYILGFDIGPAQARNAVPDFARLAQATGGKFLQVDSGQGLLDALQKVLGTDGPS
jgi:hypothetical protein